MMILLLGCSQEQKLEPVPVGEMKEYNDPGIGFGIHHPADWVVNATVGRVKMYNAPDVDKKFLDPAGVGSIGVEISIEVTRVPDPAARAQEIKSELTAQNFQLGQEQTVTVSGMAATKVPYTANWGGKNIIYGHRVFVPVDSMLYDIGFAGFGEYYNAHAAVFEASLNSFRLPKPKEKGVDETLPSEVMSAYDAKLFTFDYPDNFNFTNPPKGKNELVVELRGVRQDCSIRFDVFGAEGLTVDKVYEQNKGKYKATSSGQTTVGGQPAWTLTYQATQNVERRFYFVVKDNKVIRTTLDWYKPQRDAYLTAYDKVMKSVKFR
jgi:hypothetical protein